MLHQLGLTFHSWMLSSPFFAQDEAISPTGTGDMMSQIAAHLVVAIVFTLVGMLLFGLCIWLIVKIAPFSVQKEIEEDQNTSLGIIMGSLILGIALILAAAIHG